MFRINNYLYFFSRFVGINASDVNKAKGRYFGTAKPPYGIGFEVKLTAILFI